MVRTQPFQGCNGEFEPPYAHQVGQICLDILTEEAIREEIHSDAALSDGANPSSLIIWRVGEMASYRVHAPKFWIQVPSPQPKILSFALSAIFRIFLFNRLQMPIYSHKIYILCSSLRAVAALFAVKHCKDMCDHTNLN